MWRSSNYCEPLGGKRSTAHDRTAPRAAAASAFWSVMVSLDDPRAARAMRKAIGDAVGANAVGSGGQAAARVEVFELRSR